MSKNVVWLVPRRSRNETVRHVRRRTDHENYSTQVSEFGLDKIMLSRILAKKRQTGQTLRSNPPNMQLIILFDVIEQTHKPIPADQIAAVTCRGRRYRVD
ncbi:MAG: hypothetical protein ACYSU3_08420 [Planctomycetota bacterium]